MAAKKTTTSETTQLALIEQERFADLIRYEPHPRKPAVGRPDKPFIYIDLILDTEGLEDLGSGDVLLNFPKLKLLQTGSKEFEAGSEVDGAKSGMYWDADSLTEIPLGTEVVPLYSYKIEYPRDDPKNPIQDVFHVVFCTYEFLSNYEEWLTRCLDEDDLEAGMAILRNLYSFQFSPMGNKVYKDMQTTAITQGGLYSRVVKLGRQPGKNEQGSWWEPRFAPVRLLTDNEKIVARSLKELCRSVWAQIEKFYNRRNTLPEDYNEISGQGSLDTSPDTLS
jgi:hypothetical protein